MPTNLCSFKQKYGSIKFACVQTILLSRNQGVSEEKNPTQQGGLTAKWRPAQGFWLAVRNNQTWTRAKARPWSFQTTIVSGCLGPTWMPEMTSTNQIQVNESRSWGNRAFLLSLLLWNGKWRCFQDWLLSLFIHKENIFAKAKMTSCPYGGKSVYSKEAKP